MSKRRMVAKYEKNNEGVVFQMKQEYEKNTFLNIHH